ncbi:hypothetical protein PAXRUDRAFT_159312 [Paxillus rubicundulus Ve08.2h10]|uniref:Uncharacterized protein n=1 Tax=Paxillus rubicundulus Ve08.2h10 TaxID=930991 RepID=A0A0D0CX96_9AGAM|nr:hypothetical protein PAXRUDRAFT_159312 [Paxillus rubicundulus Ve08.2h10]
MNVFTSLSVDICTWKGALGFNIGAAPDLTPTRKGKSLIQHCADTTVKFFDTENQDLKWAKDNIKMLKLVIKNCIGNTFHALFQELGETEHGLIVSGCDEDLQACSDAANIWGISILLVIICTH